MPPKRKNTRAAKSASKRQKVVKKPASVANGATSAGASLSTETTTQAGAVNVMGSTEGTTLPAVVTAEPAAQPAVTAAATSESDFSPRFVGKFDLYSTKLPFLTKHYLPPGAKEPQFEAVYKEILVWQAKPDFSIRIALLEDAPDKPVAKHGMFSCGEVYNPLSEEEITPIHIVHGAAKTVSFSAKETLHQSMVGRAPGYIARLELNAGECDQCHCGMINSGAGSLKMRKVWEGTNETGEKQELFEGYFFFKTQHGATLRRKNWGPSMPYSSGFWGVRALKDEDGEEIGIDAGDGSYKANGTRVLEDDTGLGDSDEGSDEESDGDEFGFYNPFL